MSDQDPKFIPIVILVLLFGGTQFYFEHQGIKAQGGSRAKNYRAAGGESLRAGIRFAWQTPYHTGTIIQIVLILLMIASNWF